MKILLLRLRLIGDVMFTTPVIRALRRAYPNAHLAYVVEPAAAPIVINNPHLDEVIIARRSRGVPRIVDDLSLARRKRKRQPAVARPGSPREESHEEPARGLRRVK